MIDNFLKRGDLPYLRSFSAHSAVRVMEQEGLEKQMADKVNQNRQKMQKALEATAENTAQTNQQLQQIIKNQNDYIELLKQQLKSNEQQLDVLKNIFVSDEDGVIVEKEILKLIRDQIDTHHPMWEYVKDKTGDVAVGGIMAGTPIIYNALKAYLAAKGIVLP